MKTYLGIDLGGTNVRVAKVTRDGIVLAEVKRPSLAQEGPRRVCLLYTSPSPRDRQKSRMPSSA